MPAFERQHRAEAPTILAVASLRLVLIRRGGRIGLRVRDTAAPAIGAFALLPYFEVDPRWRIIGHLIRPRLRS